MYLYIPNDEVNKDEQGRIYGCDIYLLGHVYGIVTLAYRSGFSWNEKVQVLPRRLIIFISFSFAAVAINSNPTKVKLRKTKIFLHTTYFLRIFC